ncbi:NAT_SF domain containing protein [Acidimicrobiia bacterium]
MPRAEFDSEGCARVGIIADIDVLSALATDLYRALRTERGGSAHLALHGRAEPLMDSIVADMSNPSALVVSGMVDGSILGYAVCRLTKTLDSALIAVIEEIYTDPDARRVGIGEAMLDLITEWAAANEAAGIDAIALPGMRDTKNFFESFGLTARAITVHKKLP